MVLLPGLTSTKKSAIQTFLEDILRLGITEIALFPTCLTTPEREALYRDLEKIPDLVIPHVHLRSDCGEAEIEYLSSRFAAEAFNIHPRKSTHPFPVIPRAHERRFFIENVDIPPEDDELSAAGGLCPDFSHLENARIHGRIEYTGRMYRFFSRFAVGCCHISAVRPGDPNTWSGEWDHHFFKSFSDFDYLAAYGAFMPARWASLELENTLPEQLEVSRYLYGLLSGKTAAGG